MCNLVTRSYVEEARFTGSVSTVGDTATLILDANVDGMFVCSLDGGAFQPCTVLNTIQLHAH